MKMDVKFDGTCGYAGVRCRTAPGCVVGPATTATAPHWLSDYATTIILLFENDEVIQRLYAIELRRFRPCSSIKTCPSAHGGRTRHCAYSQDRCVSVPSNFLWSFRKLVLSIP